MGIKKILKAVVEKPRPSDAEAKQRGRQKLGKEEARKSRRLAAGKEVY